MYLLVEICFISALVYHCALSSVVWTGNGAIRGRFVQDDDVSYYSYRGIPYAEAPVGNLRFKPPVPKQSWGDTLDATEFGPVCPQTPDTYSLEDMSEDCLNLNIYVPVTHSYDPMPVLVEIHSGEFRKQSNRDNIFGPKFQMKNGVILVVLQYRLGALGFLSVQTEEASGNAGLKDALLALKWVKTNIAQFGGDPENVTLEGASSAAVMVHCFLLSKQSTGLFKRAVLRSGSVLGYRFLNRYPTKSALRLGSEMGLQTYNTDELMQYLRDADWLDIINATQRVESKDNRRGFRPSTPFVVVVEPESPNTFLTKNPIDIIQSGIPQNVPVIVGFNAQEGINMIPTIRKDPALLDYLNDDFELCIPSDIEYPYRSTESINLAKSIKDFYLNGEDISNATIYSYINLITDTQFFFATDRWIKIHRSTSNGVPLYYYFFDFDGDLNYFKINYNVTDIKGTSHADDFGYTFVTKVTKPRLATASYESLQTKDVFVALTTNFFKNGVPTPSPQLTNEVSITWPDYYQSSKYLVLDNQPHLTPGPPLKERLEFWYKAYEDYETYVRNGGELEAKLP